MGPGKWTPENGYLAPEEGKLNLKEHNRLIYKRLWQWMTTHPDHALYLEAMKLLTLWGFYPYFAELKFQFFIGNIPILILFFLSILAMWKWRKYYRELCRLWILPVFISFVALLAVGSWRYRLTSDLALIILSTMYLYSFFFFKPVIRSVLWK
jgi:hypothetical protein